MCERQEQKLLPALRESEPMRSTRSDRNERLHHLITRALLIGPGIDERSQTPPAKGREDQHLPDEQQSWYRSISHMTRSNTGGETNRETDNRQHQRCSEVRLFHHQPCQNSQHNHAWHKCLPE